MFYGPDLRHPLIGLFEVAETNRSESSCQTMQQIIKRIPGAAGFHVRPRIWVVEKRFAWITKHCRCVRDYEPDHHEAMVHLAMITTMTGRLART